MSTETKRNVTLMSICWLSHKTALCLGHLPSVLILDDVTRPELGDTLHNRITLLLKPGLVLGSNKVVPLRERNIVVQVIFVVITGPDAYHNGDIP